MYRAMLNTNSVYKDQLTANLRTYKDGKVTNLTDNGNNINGMVYFNYIQSLQKLYFRNEQFGASFGYTKSITELNDSPDWYELPLTQTIAGDKFVDNKYIVANDGKYLINSNILAIIQKGKADVYIGDYWIADVPDEVFRSGIYVNDVLQDIHGSQFARSFNDADAVYRYHNQISLNGSQLLSLKRGDKIDLRINLFRYYYVDDPPIEYKGNYNIIFINKD